MNEAGDGPGEHQPNGENDDNVNNNNEFRDRGAAQHDPGVAVSEAEESSVSCNAANTGDEEDEESSSTIAIRSQVPQNDQQHEVNDQVPRHYEHLDSVAVDNAAEGPYQANMPHFLNHHPPHVLNPDMMHHHAPLLLPFQGQPMYATHHHLYPPSSHMCSPLLPPVHHHPYQLPPPIPPPPQENVVVAEQSHAAMAQLHHYESRMRDHAVAYASAAAGAAWAAAQIAAYAATNTAACVRSFTEANAQHQLPLPPPWQAQSNSLSHCCPPPPHYDLGGASFQNQHTVYSRDFFHDHGSGDQEEFINDQICSQQQQQLDFRHRRKRQQLRPPPSDSSSPVPQSVMATSSTAAVTSNPPVRNKVRRRLRSSLECDNSSSSGSNLRRSSASSRSHYKKKARSDESLLGKSAVSALYEWCSKERRRPTPIFRQRTITSAPYPQSDINDSNASTTSASTCQGEFECIVLLEQQECGRGRGRTKAAAKQDAARRALLALVPGVIFDEATGILVKLPQSQPTAEITASERSPATEVSIAHHDKSALEDLAPNLARRLAIGRDEDDELVVSKDVNVKLDSIPVKADNQQQAKRTLSVYPGTSTTDEEDESTYYASRGASVCSALLHAMIQIDDRFPESPNFNFEIAPISKTTRASSSAGSVKRKAVAAISDSNTVSRVTRGPFTCTARLKILKSSRTSRNLLKLKDTLNESNAAADSKSCVDGDKSDSQEEFLEASAVGGTKREARHVASARLLALLFPECSTMVEVKAAAEAAREKYAASKAIKQHQKETFSSAQRQRNVDTRAEKDRLSSYFSMVSRSQPSDPVLPESFVQDFCLLSGIKAKSNCSKLRESDETTDKSLEERESDFFFRQLSRQKQLDAGVELALQIVNEKDEEGRSLPEELTADDVGRTVLRRGLPDDMSRIKKLFEGSNSLPDLFSPPGTHPNSPGESLDDITEAFQVSAARLWSLSSSVVLLLCRAISAYEDPPLGCALLSLGFSLERGRQLVVSQLASEPHLPRERFIECLQEFARAMKCELKVSICESHKSNSCRPNCEKRNFSRSDSLRLIASHISAFHNKCNEANNALVIIKKDTSSLSEDALKRMSSPLQSVLEESEVSESSAEKKSKRSTKPSKRSRVK